MQGLKRPLSGFWQPINRLLLICFVLIALVPVSFLGVKLYRAAWANAWREIHEKHRLLAMNLAEPIRIYVEDHRRMLFMLAYRITEVDSARARARNTALLLEAVRKLHDYRSLVLMDAHGHASVVTAPGQQGEIPTHLFAKEPSYLRTLASGKSQLSGVKYSPLDGRPTVVLSQPVRNQQGKVIGALLGELRLDLIEKLRRNIHFGKHGHSAIVDNFGHVIAHPSPQWRAHMHDLSKLKIVQAMMAGKTGVTEFYSPYTEKRMVAGYASVPDIGWGVMVPQPRSEVEAQVWSLLYSQLSWALGGLGLAVLFAVLLARWITRPINRLAADAKQLADNGYTGTLTALPKSAPREICQLGTALRELITGLQGSREEIGQLNRSLQSRVDHATEQLRETNSRLEAALARADEFVSFARHDLRKPVAVITDIAETLQSELTAESGEHEELIETLGLIVKSANYMKSIINDFLGHHALQNGPMTLDTKPMDINQLIRLTLDSNRGYAGRKEIALAAELDSSLPFIDADEIRLSQVLHNLVDNAIKFGSAGDIVTVRSCRNDPYAIVEVCDTGPGLSPEDFQRVFSKHMRLSNRPTGGEISTGLGLAICLHIVELHGGKIGVRNNPERGCTFWLRLQLGETNISATENSTPQQIGQNRSGNATAI